MAADKLLPRVVLPAGLMYRISQPSGVPPHDSPRRAQLHVLAHSAALASIPEAERRAIVWSLARTHTRAAYHEARFLELRKELDVRRASLPGEVVLDTLIEYVHFELQAFAGASRVMLDELVYIIARKHGIPPNRAKRKPWEAADLVQKPLPAECNVPEVHLLVSKATWFDTLNAYRNSFFHHGWRHGGGHFSLTDQRASARSPARNGLLVPDRASLSGRRKPFEWTWNDGTTIDDVAKTISTGNNELLSDLVGAMWATPPPPPGAIPLNEQPNVVVILAKAALMVAPHGLFLPLFSTEEKARSFQPFANSPDIELVDVPTSETVIGSPAVSITLSGIRRDELPSGVEHIDILLDPTANPDWTSITAALHVRIVLSDLLAAGTEQPVSIPMPHHDRVWLWRSKFDHDWIS